MHEIIQTSKNNLRPNIILMNCDDLGYGDLGCYGSKKNDTPFLDYLAKKGRRFTDFYMGSPVCSPSRAAMMTGCYPPRIGFTTFHGDWVLFPGDHEGLNPSEITFPKLLQKSGYRTFMVGKWHCGDQPEFLPTRHGFDHYYGLPYSNDMAPMELRKNMPPLPLIEDEQVIQAQPDQCSLTERYVERSQAFIRAHQNEPFFLYFAHMHVHKPLYAAAPFVQNSRNGDYGACVAAIDWSCKAIMDTVESLGLSDRTLFLFTSDNGSRNDFGESNGPLRGTKATTFEGGMRVPLIAYWKNHIKPSCTDGILSALDLYTSLLKLADCTPPDDRIIDSIEQLDFILGTSNQSKRDTILYYMSHNLEAIRYQEWKLHVSRRPNADKPSDQHDGIDTSGIQTNENIAVQELYNLKNDPKESNNLYEQYPDVVKKLMEKIEIYRTELGDAYTGQSGTSVRPIGYVDDAKPLTTYDPDHPYIIAFYDRNEVG